MQSYHRKHYATLARPELGLPKLRVEPRTERAKPYIRAHSLTTNEAAAMLNCIPGDIEALVAKHILIGRNIKTSRGRMWIVCAACIAQLYACSQEEREEIIRQATTGFDEMKTDWMDEEFD